MRALVTGAGGFIGHHLVRYLRERDYYVRGVDLHWPEFTAAYADEFHLWNLRNPDRCVEAVRGMDEVYHLAADMGGIGYITYHHADVARNNVLMDANMAWAASLQLPERYFYSSSACVYPAHLQTVTDLLPLSESDAIPANPERGYGWEKLYAEQLASYHAEDHGLPVRIARFHNIYGPEGTFEGGREKAPAAICRKVALARDGDEIEVWGDGLQTRSFTHISDCVEGIYRIAHSDHPEPLNLGSDEMVTIDELAELVIDISGKALRIAHAEDAPQGVRGRNSDNALARKVLDWEPSMSLRTGMTDTYRWIEEHVRPASTAELDMRDRHL